MELWSVAMATIFYASSLSLCDLRQQTQAKRFVPVPRLWILGLGFWEMGLDVWEKRRKRKKAGEEEGKNCLEKKMEKWVLFLSFWGLEEESRTIDGERKIRMKEEESRAGTRVPRGFEIHLSFTSTENLSLLGSSCYGELESKRLEMQVS